MVQDWFQDGLFIVDTTINTPEPYASIPTYQQAFAFTHSGILVGAFEEDYEYAYGDPDPYRSTEYSQWFYDSSKFDQNLFDDYSDQYSSFGIASTAPLFLGYEDNQLGFDWLTQNNSEWVDAVSPYIGSSAPHLGLNQVYIAMEDCDILTGLGKDLIILADDINNEGVDAVPRLLDFDPVHDKILLPSDIFTSLAGDNPGAISSNRFSASTRATESTHRIIFDATTGHLFYDSDGNGSASQQLIATFSNSPVLSTDSFLIG